MELKLMHPKGCSDVGLGQVLTACDEAQAKVTLRQVVEILNQYDTYSQYYGGLGDTKPYRRLDIPNEVLEQLREASR